MPRVFISYSHDSPEHCDAVLNLSDRLREQGIDCIIDQYEFSPPEGWHRWTEKQIRDADFVLMICSEGYYKKVMGMEPPDLGLGVKWESNLIYQHLYDAGTQNKKFIPVLLKNCKTDYIPTPVKGATYYFCDTQEGYEKLYRHLTHQPAIKKPKLGEMQSLPPLQRQTDFFKPCNVPYPKNPFFTGREDVLKRLYETLIFTKATVISQTQAISGLGGIGKTQTAVEYTYRYRNFYKAILWVTAETIGTLISDFVKIAALLNLPEKDAEQQELAVAAVKLGLQRNSDWLLIFDNADTPELIEDFMPFDFQGHILLTSRAQAFDNLGIINPIEMQQMTPNEAEKFLIKRTGRSRLTRSERECLKKLAEELGYLPLALEQAGAYIYRKKCSFQDYLLSYRKMGIKLLEKSKVIAAKYPKSVATTWLINF
ncbi:MAG: TIR domain-containing protein [candidate division KSB1 bacterium]|nr:TIR domain-containing protein [candidate division KSB1 bacterium]